MSIYSIYAGTDWLGIVGKASAYRSQVGSVLRIVVRGTGGEHGIEPVHLSRHHAF